MMEEDRLKKALLDPASAFRTPATVMMDKTLTTQQKIEILRRWEYDACEVSVAEEEGMPLRDGETLRQALQALQEDAGDLNTGDTSPNKQGGLTRKAVRRPERKL